MSHHYELYCNTCKEALTCCEFSHADGLRCISELIAHASVLSKAGRLISPLLSEQLEDVAITRWDGTISLLILAEHAGH